MRLYRLEEEERRAMRAPVEVDGLGLLVLSLFGRWQRDAVFVLVTTFVDESGTGGHDRIMLGALVARAHRWHKLNPGWRKLLKAHEIPFSHLVAMENGEAPFEHFKPGQTRRFAGVAHDLIEGHCDFGYTAAIDLAVHKKEYSAKLDPRAGQDSAYGLCARAIIEAVALEAMAAFGPKTVVNFVFEESSNFGGVERVFHDLKKHSDPVKAHLGTIASAAKADYAGLQAADMIASLGRRAEPTAKFLSNREPGVSIVNAVRQRVGRAKCPIFHVSLVAEAMDVFRQQAEEIAKEKKWARRAKGFANRRARQNP
jgi:hypothetical protein